MGTSIGMPGIMGHISFKTSQITYVKQLILACSIHPLAPGASRCLEVLGQWFLHWGSETIHRVKVYTYLVQI